MDTTNQTKESTLKYSGERDRSYGLAAMALTLAATEDNTPFCTVTLDSEIGEAIDIMARAVPQRIEAVDVAMMFRRRLHMFRLGARAVMANIIARSQAPGSPAVRRDAYDTIVEALCRQGVEDYSLDDDEARHLVEQEYSYAYKVINHPSVPQLVQRIADELVRRRTLTGREVLDLSSVR